MSVNTAISTAPAGATIVAVDGSYGNLSYNAGTNATPEQPITFRSLNGRAAHFESILWRFNDNAILKNLSVWPTAATITPPADYVFLNGTNHVVDGLDVRSHVDAETTMFGWTEQEWISRAKNGILVDTNSIIKNCSVRGCFFSLVVGSGSQLLNNLVRGFAGDGIRFFGSDIVVRGNTVRDSVAIGGNHNDAMQSFTTISNPFSDVLIENNLILGWTLDSANPLRSGPMQGIGLFDGPYVRWTLRNNIIANTQTHGITINDSTDAVIVHNTVVNLEPGFAEPAASPKISVFDEAPGATSNALIANNIATNYNTVAGQTTLVGNVIVALPTDGFVDPASFNYAPLPGAAWIGQADPAHVVATDFFGNPRDPLNPTAGAIAP